MEFEGRVELPPGLLRILQDRFRVLFPNALKSDGEERDQMLVLWPR